MNLDVAVIADDLTSAADGAAPFIAAGLRAEVLLDLASAGSVNGGADVLAIDLDSRPCAPAVAAEITAAGMRAVKGRRVLYKTIDSTLRGNIREEVHAALAASGRRTAVVAPAFPAGGRTTAGGVQLLDGVPIHMTVFADDPTHPVRSSTLADVLPESVPWAPGRPLPDGMVFVDAATDADLDRVVADMPLEEVLWVGSPGIAAALARAISTDQHSTAEPRVPPVRRVLVVVGSRNRASLAQLDELVPPADVIDVGRPVGDVDSALTAAFARRDVVGLTDFTVGSTVTDAAARLSRAIVAARAARLFDALIVTGGATARAILDALHVEALELLAEPEPGIVAAATTGPDPLPILMKAGGFGDPDTFTRLHRLLISQIG